MDLLGLSVGITAFRAAVGAGQEKEFCQAVFSWLDENVVAMPGVNFPSPWLCQPLFIAENLAGFAASCPLAESLVMVVAGIGGKPPFAGLAFSLMAFHKNTTESRYAGITK